tara:strand:+ start:167 stop:1015 length:849 start_codon:yes stop_codon:yes gene_type:complete
MADLPISGLPVITRVSSSYVTAVVSGSVTAQMSVKQIGDAYSSSISPFPYNGNAQITGSLNVFGGITGSFLGTASFAGTSSFAISASFVTGSNVYGPFGSNSILSASYALTASYSNTSATASYWAGSSQYTPTAYLSAFHTGSMTNPVINTANTMSFSVTDFAYGITVSGSYSDKIKVTNAGVYNIQFSAQFDKTNSANSTAYIWLSKNGSNIASTNTGLTLGGGANDSAVAAWNFFVSASANDYLQLVWGATDTNTVILYDATPIVGPAIPSVILTVNRIA